MYHFLFDIPHIAPYHLNTDFYRAGFRKWHSIFLIKFYVYRFNFPRAPQCCMENGKAGYQPASFIFLSPSLFLNKSIHRLNSGYRFPGRSTGSTGLGNKILLGGWFPKVRPQCRGSSYNLGANHPSDSWRCSSQPGFLRSLRSSAVLGPNRTLFLRSVMAVWMRRG